MALETILLLLVEVKAVAQVVSIVSGRGGIQSREVIRLSAGLKTDSSHRLPERLS